MIQILSGPSSVRFARIRTNTFVSKLKDKFSDGWTDIVDLNTVEHCADEEARDKFMLEVRSELLENVWNLSQPTIEIVHKFTGIHKFICTVMPEVTVMKIELKNSIDDIFKTYVKKVVEKLMKEKEIVYLEKLSDIDIKISEKIPSYWKKELEHTEGEFDEYPEDFKNFEKYDSQVRSIFHSEMQKSFSAKYEHYNFKVFKKWDFNNTFAVQMRRLGKEEIEAAKKKKEERRGLKRKREESSGCVIA